MTNMIKLLGASAAVLALGACANTGLSPDRQDTAEAAGIGAAAGALLGATAGGVDPGTGAAVGAAAGAAADIGEEELDGRY